MTARRVNWRSSWQDQLWPDAAVPFLIRFESSLAHGWNLLIGGSAAVVLGSALTFKAGHIDYGFGFALGGLATNAMPPTIVWATMKWIK